MKLQIFAPQWTMWYFVSLMSFYILSDFIKDKKKWFIFSIIAALYIGFDHSVGSYGSIARTFFFLPFFISGMCFDEKYIEIIKKHKYKVIGAASLCLVFLFVVSEYTPVDLLFEYSRYTSEFDNAAFPLFMRAFHYVSAFAVSAVIIMVIPEKKIALSTIGQNSVVMYFIHASVIKLLNKYDVVSYSSKFNVILSEIIIVTVCISLTIIYSQLKYISKVKRYTVKSLN